MIVESDVSTVIVGSSQRGVVEDGLSVAVMIGISAWTTELNGAFRFLGCP